MRRPPVIIAPFSPADAHAVAALNQAWLVGHGLLELADGQQLYDPDEHIFAHGKVGEPPAFCRRVARGLRRGRAAAVGGLASTA